MVKITITYKKYRKNKNKYYVDVKFLSLINFFSIVILVYIVNMRLCKKSSFCSEMHILAIFDKDLMNIRLEELNNINKRIY
ncbi:hypothetical protein BpHYR1_027168 [Brachionus plicatilis]|uniref:Uncharacterized protein n=1 Tax=Brachionus plicatilis TaxID=10195 RepID=A0A3M7QFY5_BRAPC|nr:hypothetical protein BpHYR1_027168 [Brachionus plicatilis]